MKVLVIGGGPIGLRHLRNALALGHEAALARRADGAPPPGAPPVPVFVGLDAAAAWEPEAVVVATPPSRHLDDARWAIARGSGVLVEKPLAARLAGVEALLREAAGAGVHVAVGYNLRFHPGLRAVADAVASGSAGRLLSARLEVGSHLPSWHPELDYRHGAAARRDLGGGALLALAHELDLALWIAGPGRLVAGAAARVSDLELDVEDVAELVLRHDGGAFVSVHVDLLDRAYNRRSRWVGSEATIEWHWGGAVTLTRDGAVEVLWEDDGFDLARTYVDELEAFLRGEPPPGDALGDARRALELIETVERP